MTLDGPAEVDGPLAEAVVLAIILVLAVVVVWPGDPHALAWVHPNNLLLWAGLTAAFWGILWTAGRLRRMRTAR